MSGCTARHAQWQKDKKNLRDASLELLLELPLRLAVLLERGYSEEDIEKIWSGNVMRVWREVERIGSL